MVNYHVKEKLLKQIEENKELQRKSENVYKYKIKVSKEVYDKAEKMAKELNTDVEGILAFAARAFLGVPLYSTVVDDGY